MKVWADYLFPVLDDAPENVQFSISDDDIIWVTVSSGHEMSSWMKMMASTKKVTDSRASTTRRTTPCLEKLFLLVSYQSG